MNQSQWSAVDECLAKKLLPIDPILSETLAANRKAELPAIDVSPLQGRFLYLLVQMIGARRILEIGTLGGYSTICLARALPSDGKLVTLELEEKHARVAQENIERAGLKARVRILVGPAIHSLEKLKADQEVPFDFIFIDADKPSTPDYYRLAMDLSRPGTVIIADNVIRNGDLADEKCQDPKVQGMQRLMEIWARDPRLEASALQTVGCKGYDGFAIARVR